MGAGLSTSRPEDEIKRLSELLAAQIDNVNEKSRVRDSLLTDFQKAEKELCAAVAERQATHYKLQDALKDNGSDGASPYWVRR